MRFKINAPLATSAIIQGIFKFAAVTEVIVVIVQTFGVFAILTGVAFLTPKGCTQEIFTCIGLYISTLTNPIVSVVVEAGAVDPLNTLICK